MASRQELARAERLRKQVASSLTPKQLRLIADVAECVETNLMDANPTVRADNKRLKKLYAELDEIRKHENG